MKNYYSKIRELEKELERNKKIYSKLCRQRENLNDRKGVVMLTECMDLEIQLISVSITISSISEQLRYLHEEYKKYKLCLRVIIRYLMLRRWDRVITLLR